MTGPILILTLAYVAVAFLLLNLNLATRYSSWVKGAAIVGVSLLYVTTWHGYWGLLGWPSPEPLPNDFRVLWITLQDPDKANALPGSIYYWIREIDETGQVAGTPRAHAIAWNEAAAEAAQEALEQMREGEVLNGRRTRNPLAPLKDSASSEEGDLYTLLSDGEEARPPRFEFIAVRPPSLPAKGPPAAGD